MPLLISGFDCINATARVRGSEHPYQLRVHSRKQEFKALTAKDPGLVNRLGEHALGRGVPVINIVEPELRFHLVRITCRSMTIPFGMLDHAIKQNVSFDALRQPEPPIGIDIDYGIAGNGIVMAFGGVVIEHGARFQSQAGSPIILRENSTINSTAVIKAGELVGPGEIRS